MKTFLTEKGNIPDGATHYRDETSRDSFAWFREGVTELIVNGNSISGMDLAISSENLSNLKPIPQTNMETPEEKEVEWANGELLEFMGEPCVFIGMSEGSAIVRYTKDADRALAGVISEVCSVNMISKPETEAERVEREREEFKVEMCKDLGIDAVGCNTACIINKLYELGYRKES